MFSLYLSESGTCTLISPALYPKIVIKFRPQYCRNKIPYSFSNLGNVMSCNHLHRYDSTYIFTTYFIMM